MLACLWLACGLFPSIPALRRDIQANSVILAHDAQPAVENITLFPEHFTYKAVPETGQSQSNRKNGQKWPPALLLANFGTKVEMDRSATSETARYMGLWKIQAQSRNQENEWDAWYLPKCVSNSEVNLVKPKRWESHDGCEKVSRHKACPTGYAIVCKQYNVFGKMINLMCCCPQDNLFYKRRRRGGKERHARKCLAGEEPGSKDGKSFILQSEGGSQKALTSLADTIKTDFASRAVLAQVTRSQHIPNPAADPTLLASTSAAACGQGLVQYFMFYYFVNTDYDMTTQYKGPARASDFHTTTKISCSIDIAPTSEEIVVTNRAIFCNNYDQTKCVKLCLITKLPHTLISFQSVEEIPSIWQLEMAREDELHDVQTAFSDARTWNGEYQRCANR